MSAWEWIKTRWIRRSMWALERAIRIGSLSGARWAAGHGAALDDPFREPALCQALRNSPNPEAMCLELLRLGAGASRASRLDGNEPLHLVVFCAQAPEAALSIAQALLAAGADPNARNRLGDTPLTIAARERCWEPWRARLCEELLRSGADPERPGAKGVGADALLKESLDQRDKSLDALLAGGGFMSSTIALWKHEEAELIARLKASFEAALLKNASAPARLAPASANRSGSRARL